MLASAAVGRQALFIGSARNQWGGAAKCKTPSHTFPGGKKILHRGITFLFYGYKYNETVIKCRSSIKKLCSKKLSGIPVMLTMNDKFSTGVFVKNSSQNN
jgi:hypothetical protein